MGKPQITTVCDKCGKKHETDLWGAKSLVGNYVYTDWLPKGWALHDTQDGDGPEPNKTFVMCERCERQFQLSVRDFKPSMVS
jgi:hypothetical protein